MGEGAVGPGGRGRWEKDARAAACPQPVAEAALSPQGTGASTDPGGAAAAPFWPWPRRLGSGRRRGAAGPEPRAAGVGRRGGLGRALGRRTRVRFPT